METQRTGVEGARRPVRVAAVRAVIVAGSLLAPASGFGAATRSGGVGYASAKPVVPAALRLAVARTAATAATAAAAVTVAAPTVLAVGATYRGSPAPTAPAVTAIASTADGDGYYVLRSDGEVTAYGAPSYGSVPAPLGQGETATGIAVDPETGGYWVTSSMGQVWGFNAPLLGRVHVHPGGWGQYPPVVAIAAVSPKPRAALPLSASPGVTRPAAPAGYVLLRANGRARAFGAKWYGDIERKIRYGKTAPVVATGTASDPSTGGYWILTSNGGIYSFRAPWFGSPSSYGHGAQALGWSALAALPGGDGYIATASDGWTLRFSSAGTISRHIGLALGASAIGVATAGATGRGFRLAVDDTPFDGYFNPLRQVAALVPQEIDQGVDYCGSGPVYAIGTGVVVNTRDSGWPSGTFISYRLTSGPASGLVVYVAENVTPEVYVGEVVGPETVLGVVHDSRTCMETGWANVADPHEQAAAHYEYTGANSTAYGRNFSSLLARLGARPGLVQPGPPGPLPPGWPKW